MHRLNRSVRILVALILVCTACIATAIATVPGTMSIQGILRDTNNNPLPDGSHDILFLIWDAQSGGTLLWNEQRTLSTVNGLFSAVMGISVPIPDSVFNSPNRWFSVSVSPHPEMLPRIRLSSAAYAFEADQWTTVGPNIYRLDGNVGIGTTNPIQRLHLAGLSSGDGIMLSGSSPGYALQTGGGAAFGEAASAGLWSQSADSGDAVMRSRSGKKLHLQSGFAAAGVTLASNGFVGIGTATPAWKLHVNGSALVNGSIHADGSLYSDGVSSQTTSGISLWGTSQDGTGVVGSSVNGWAGSFGGFVQINGGLDVNGTVTKDAGSFKIDHPLDPANKYLSHSFVESPDMMNIYNGVITTDANGNASVTMPEWFEALNRDFRYQLTVIGQFAQAIISNEINGNQFSIKTDKPNVKVSWQVTGIRQDAYANAHRIPVEELKSEKERGYYRNPELFTQPEEKDIDWVRQPELMKQMKEEREKAKAKSANE